MDNRLVYLQRFWRFGWAPFHKEHLYSRSAILAAGIAGAQIIGALSAPILARIFSPHDFGAFSLYFQSSQLLGATLALRYDQAIALQHSLKRIQDIFRVAIWAAIAVSLPIGLAALFFHSALDRITGAHLGLMWFVAVINGTLMSFLTSLSVLAIARDRISYLAASRLTKVIGSVSIQIVGGTCVVANYYFLIVGEIGGTIVGCLCLVFVLLRLGPKRDMPVRRFVSRTKWMLLDARKHAAQPAWNLPQVFFNYLSGLLLTATIVALFSQADAGAYFMMNRITMLPATLVATSMAQTYLRDAAIDAQQNGNFYASFKSLVAVQLAVGLAIGLILYFFGERLFVFALGTQWRDAGILSEIWAPYVAVHMAASAASPTPTVAGRQKPMLFVALIQNAVLLSGFYIGAHWMHSVRGALGVSAGLAVPYILGMLIWYRHLSRQPVRSSGAGFARRDYA